MLRGAAASARAEECEAITGAFDMASAARIVESATWLTSTSIPIRFISATTRLPNGERPPATASSVDESAQARLCVCVSVI